MRTVLLTFKRSELIYDIGNYSFVEGDILGDDAEHNKHLVLDVVQSGNVDRVNRVLSLAFSESVEMLYPYSKEPISEDQYEDDDTISYPDEYKIRLSVEDNFSLSTIKLLKHLIHEYLVYKVMADWMSIVNPRSQANWVDKIETVRQKIQTCLMSRMSCMRRKSKPF